MAIVPIASELSKKAYADQTKYDAREVAYGSIEDLEKEFFESIRIYKDKIEQNEFCVVMVIAADPLIKNLRRRKFYCWPYLPSPRPNQTVLLYNKELDQITKRLWVLPNPATMAELASSSLVVCKEYQSMRDWCVAFFKGTFWDFIRYQHDIKMLSQEEYFKLHREELMKAGIDISNPGPSETFDFSKIQINDIEHANAPVAQ